PIRCSSRQRSPPHRPPPSFPTRRSSDLLLFHPEESAARAGDRDRAVPGRVVALGVAQAAEEVPSLAGATLRQIAHAALPRVRLRSEEHTSELQSPYDLVCRLLLEKKNYA